MAKTKIITKEKAALTVDEGEVWVSNVHGAPLFQTPKIDAALIGKQLENHYIKSGLDKMQRVIFQDDFIIQGIDVQTDTPDKDLTASLEDMCSHQDVELDYTTQRRWRDCMGWGSGLVNPVWGNEDNEYRLLKLKRLPPESFEATGTWANVKNRILPGICYNDTTQTIEFWQKNTTGAVNQLTNVDMMVDPLASELGGTPFILPLIPIITALSFSWQKNLAQVNIFGTGGIGFVKVTNPEGDDVAFAQKLLNNESSTNRYQLRGNMEFIPMGVGPTGTALDTITELGMIIKRFFSPTDILSKESDQILGGSSGPEYQLYLSFIKGQHRWLERACRRLLYPYLVYNGYDPKKYKIVVDIPDPAIDERELDLKRGELGAKYGGISINELRKRIGEKPLEGPAGDQLIQPQKTAPVTGLQKAEVMAKFVHPIDPYGVISKDQQKVFLQKTLELDEGDEDIDFEQGGRGSGNFGHPGVKGRRWGKGVKKKPEFGVPNENPYDGPQPNYSVDIISKLGDTGREGIFKEAAMEAKRIKDRLDELEVEIAVFAGLPPEEQGGKTIDDLIQEQVDLNAEYGIAVAIANEAYAKLGKKVKDRLR